MEEKKASDEKNFKDAVSEKITDKIGVFSLLPIYKACLVNKNSIYIENKLTEDLDKTFGAIAIYQKNSYAFYASRNGFDCENVIKNKFLNNPSRIEQSYGVSLELGPEDAEKFFLGQKDFRFYIKSFRLDTESSYITLRINLWGWILTYVIILLAWSAIFFQFRSIRRYIKGDKESN